MRFILLILLFLCFNSFSQETNSIYELPYKSVAKKLLIDEQISSYNDDYHTYVYFKPTLVNRATITIIAHGRAVYSKVVKVDNFNNIFELKRKDAKYIILVEIEGYIHILEIPGLGEPN
jgi:hypothetical protein